MVDFCWKCEQDVDELTEDGKCEPCTESARWHYQESRVY